MLEFKEQWNASALEIIGAFANTRDGTLLVGISDDGQLVGWNDTARKFQLVSNQKSRALENWSITH